MDKLSSHHNKAAGLPGHEESDDQPDNQPDNQQGQSRLSGLQRDPDERRSENKRYSRFIKSLKIVLPVTALGVIAVLFSWNALNVESVAPVTPDPAMTPVAGTNQLVNPRFDSVDEKNQPYTITAETALQNLQDERIFLEKPLADIVLNDGQWLALSAEKGLFKQQEQTLKLETNVTLFHDAGYQFATPGLHIDLKTSTAQTSQPVSGHGPLGTLDAQGMHADNVQETLVFHGPAKLVIYDSENANISEVFNP